jgi:hypothetical protein
MQSLLALKNSKIFETFSFYQIALETKLLLMLINCKRITVRLLLDTDLKIFMQTVLTNFKDLLEIINLHL